MAINSVHETIGFSKCGGPIIAAVAAKVYPPEWAYTITNCIDRPMWANISLTNPDQAAYTENIYYAEAALEGGEFWWAKTLRAVLTKARRQIRIRHEGAMPLFGTMSCDHNACDRIQVLPGVVQMDGTLELDAAA